MNPMEVSVTAANRIKGLIRIRDCVRTLIDYQTLAYELRAKRPGDDLLLTQHHFRVRLIVPVE